MFEFAPEKSWWLQPRLFLYFLGFSGVTMATIGFYIYAKLRDIYPYNLIATACLTEAAIYFRFMRIIVCPTYVYVFIIYYFPIYGWHNINNAQLFKSFQAIILLFAGQVYSIAVVNLSLQVFICIDFYMMLKNPFYPRRRRGRLAHLFHFLLFIAIIALYIHVILE